MATNKDKETDDLLKKLTESQKSLRDYSAELVNLAPNLSKALMTLVTSSSDFNAQLKEINSELDVAKEFRDISDLARKTAASVKSIGTSYFDAANYQKALQSNQEAIDVVTKSVLDSNVELNELISKRKDEAKALEHHEVKMQDLQREMQTAAAGELVLIEQKIKSQQQLTEETIKQLELIDERKDTLTTLIKEKELEEKMLKSKQAQLHVLKALQEKYAKIHELAVDTGFNLDEAASSLGSMADPLLKVFNKFPVLSNVLGVDKLIKTFKTKLKSSLVDAFLETEGDTGKSMFSAAIQGVQILIKSITPLQLGLFAVAGLVTLIVAGFQEADKNVTELSKNLDVSKETAKDIARNSDAIANSLGMAGITGKEVQAAMVDIREEFGLLQMATGATQEQFVKSFSILKDRVGLSSEEILNLNNTATLLGTNLNDLTGKAYAFGDGLIGGKATLKEISKLSKTLIVSFKGTSQELQKAVVKGKLLGFTLEDVAKAGESLLNFESSIEKEMTANVLTGKRMNLDRVRQLELMGDYVGAQDEMLKQMGDLESFSKMMPYQQKAMADAFGMSAEELTKILTKSKQLKDLGLTRVQVDQMLEGSLQEQQKRINSLTDAKQRNYLQSIVENKKQVEASEKFQASLTRLLQTVQKITYPLITLVQGVLDIVADIIDGFTSVFTSTTKIKNELTGGTDEIEGMNAAGKIALKTFVGIAAVLTTLWAGAKLVTLGKGIASVAKNSINTITGNKMPDITNVTGNDSTKSVTKSASKLKNASKIVTDSFNLVKSVAKGFTSLLNEILVGMKTTASNLIKLVTDSSKTLLDSLGKIAKSLIDSAGKILSSIIDILTTGGKKLATGLMEIGKLIVDGLESIGESILKFLDEAFSRLVNMLTTASKAMPTILGNLGKAVGTFFSEMSIGIVTFAEAMAAPTPLFGLPVGLIFLAMAMGLASAARIAAPAISAMGIMFEGLSKVVVAVGSAVSLIITSIADSFVKLGSIDAANLLGVSAAIGTLGISLTAFAAGSGIASLSSMLINLFEDDPIEKFNRFGDINVNRLNLVADSIRSLSASIKDLTVSLHDIQTSNIESAFDSINAPDNQLHINSPKVSAISPISNEIRSTNVEDIKKADKSLAASDKQMSEVVTLLKQLVGSVNQPVSLTIGTKAIDEIERQTSLRRNYSTKYDHTYGTHS